MTTGAVPLCWSCARYHIAPSLHTCDAYPKGIPVAILGWRHDHHKIYAGDNGMTYLKGEPQTKTFYDPNEPRVPAGDPTGGEWTSGDGGEVSLEKVIPNPADRQRLEEMTAKALSLPHTDQINTPERQAMRTAIVDKIYEQGGFAKMPEGGPPDITQGHEAWIVAGLPAAGKSELVEPVLAENHALLIDNDEIKAMIPESQGGIGNNATQGEASEIILPALLERAVANGDNIMMPRVGGSYDKLKADIDALKEAGYKVHMVYIDVPDRVSIERAAQRFIKSGKLVNVNYIKAVDGGPRRTFERLRAENAADTFAFYNGNTGSPHHAERIY